MEALFIGQTYIDIVFLADTIPTGDDKAVAKDYAVSFGGNAVTAAFCCAKLGVKPDLLSSLADDWLGRMFLDMAARYGIPVHGRKVKESSLSFIMPHDGKRAILRCRDDDYLHPFQQLNLNGCRGLHLDGHQPDAALHYARACQEAGVLTSLDGGGVRSNTPELLQFIDVAVVSERMCEQMQLGPVRDAGASQEQGLHHRRVTSGRRAWSGMTDRTGRHHQALPVRRRRLSTPTARAMSSTAPTCIPIWRAPRPAGTAISVSRAPPPPTRSSIWATRPGCRRWATSRR